MTAGEKLRELRGSESRESVAKEIGVTVSSWAKYERGERTPRDEVKVRIAEHFGKSVQDIFFERTEYI